MDKTVEIEGIGQIHVKRSRGRLIRLSVRYESGLWLYVPARASLAEALNFVQSKKDWILRTIRKQEERKKQSELSGNEGVNPADKEALLKELAVHAAAELPGRMAELAQEYGFTYKKLTLKRVKGYWGICRSKIGHISLNISLMRQPALLRDYVMLHELCHLRHPNHGPGFHALLEEILSRHLTSCDSPESAGFLAIAAKSRRKSPLTRTLEKELKKIHSL